MVDFLLFFFVLRFYLFVKESFGLLRISGMNEMRKNGDLTVFGLEYHGQQFDICLSEQFCDSVVHWILVLFQPASDVVSIK